MTLAELVAAAEPCEARSSVAHAVILQCGPRGPAPCEVIACHHRRIASITALAIGAASLPPVTSSPQVAAVLDHDGHRDLRRRRRGANADEPGVRRLAGVGLRGAGLAGDRDARDLALVPVPLSTTSDHHVRQLVRRPPA